MDAFDNPSLYVEGLSNVFLVNLNEEEEDKSLKQKVMSGLERALKEKEQEGMCLGEQKGIRFGEPIGKQKDIASILALVKQGHIDQDTADKILKKLSSR